MLKHVEDGAELSIFIADDGEIGFACKNGHQWTLDSKAELQRANDALAENRVGKQKLRNVIDNAMDAYPAAFAE